MYTHYTSYIYIYIYIYTHTYTYIIMTVCTTGFWRSPRQTAVQRSRAQREQHLGSSGMWRLRMRSVIIMITIIIIIVLVTLLYIAVYCNLYAKSISIKHHILKHHIL